VRASLLVSAAVGLAVFVFATLTLVVARLAADDPWSLAAPIVIGLLAFGGALVIELRTTPRE